MQDNKIIKYIKDVLANMPTGWLNLTTHRLDIYDEKLAKSQFLEQFEILFNNNNSEASALNELPTAYDYIRLGHPLSCLLEWVIANLNNLKPKNVISFSSKTIPILAILRKNSIDHKNTQIVYTGELPACFDADVLRSVYGYTFDLKKVGEVEEIAAFNGSTVFVSHRDKMNAVALSSNIDFFVGLHAHLGSILLVNGPQNETYIPDIQHVRRRETIAMTPANSLDALKLLIEKASVPTNKSKVEANKTSVLNSLMPLPVQNQRHSLLLVDSLCNMPL
jgi:hypothetical protein